MPYIADLHIHSLYSRATIKGIDVVATGDFIHPSWFAHLTENLEPAVDSIECNEIRQFKSVPPGAAETKPISNTSGTRQICV
ncbi:hypothetical protein GMJAKD_10680 [Candidatus Electrothrix aarhusensis]